MGHVPKINQYAKFQEYFLDPEVSRVGISAPKALIPMAIAGPGQIHLS
jgi:hypothetical protein